MASLKEKIGYGFGDMASSMFWKIFSYYLPFFYANIFGIGLEHAAVLFLITRIWDAVSDPMMGVIADRTDTRWGKYRPYILWFAVPFAVCGVLLFTTPDFSFTGKLVWAYITYILMMTVYTGINVPYGAMLGVITPNSDEKTVFSAYRMFFAYGGSFIALAAWEPLCRLFNGVFATGASQAPGWQWAMIVIAAVCAVLFFLCFRMTREKVHTKSEVSVGSDLGKLLRNGPWWLLIGAALSTNLFNTVRGSTVAFYFADIVGPDASLTFFGLSFLFFAGLFLAVGEVSNMLGVALTVPMAKRLGKKSTFIMVNTWLIILSVAFFYLPCTQGGFWLMLLMQILISICTGIVSPLVWSMYADVSDYSELRYHTASTGLIFSSASMAQKFGSAFGGSGALWILAAFGYITMAADGQPIVQTAGALDGLRYLMSYIPAAVALLGIIVLYFYPLTSKKMAEIDRGLRALRKNHPSGDEMIPA